MNQIMRLLWKFASQRSIPRSDQILHESSIFCQGPHAILVGVDTNFQGRFHRGHRRAGYNVQGALSHPLFDCHPSIPVSNNLIFHDQD